MTKQRNNNQTSVIDTTRVNGANELKKYIEEITEIVNQIRNEFKESLQQPDAVVVDNGHLQFTNTSKQLYNVEKSARDHRTFVYNKTKLQQFSKFLQADEVVVESLGLIETLRKMLVNNKQQKKTTIRNIRSTINELKRHQRKSAANPADGEIEAKVTSPSIERLEKEIETTKQNHCTITKRILTQVNTLLLVMRRNILAFKLAAEENLGEIICHAEKCRAFIAKCCRLEIIEFCASIWWFDTQHSECIAQHPEWSELNFSVSAELEEKFTRSSHTMTGPIENDRIKIVVECFDPMVLTVCEYEFDQTLAKTILTDEAIHAFEFAVAQENDGCYDDDDDDEYVSATTTWPCPPYVVRA
jgi:hypothetical protein